MTIGILGGGVAGLSSAYFLRDAYPDLQIHESSEQTGGLARSFRWHGFDCDLAPHRLYTDNEKLLNELLALVPMNKHRRKSRIYLRGKWIRDPVNAVEIALKFLPNPSFKVLYHYLLKSRTDEANFEQLVLSRFGAGLNELFFKPYSEKLFGIPADQISAEWGRRKIRVSGLRDMVQRRSKLYFKDFYYPIKGGYGAICDRLYAAVRTNVRLQSRLVAIEQRGRNYVCAFEDANGRRTNESFETIISSLPVNYLARLLGFHLNLRFRPALMTYLLINRAKVTDNHWFYFADKEFSINRVAEFKNFAGESVPKDQTVLCCEVTEIGDSPAERVIDELVTSGIIRKNEVVDVKTIHLPLAYPVYDLSYEREMVRAKEFFSNHPEIYHIGRQSRFEHKDIDEIFEEAEEIANLLISRNVTERTELQKAVAR